MTSAATYLIVAELLPRSLLLQPEGGRETTSVEAEKLTHVGVSQCGGQVSLQRGLKSEVLSTLMQIFLPVYLF